MTPTSLVTAKGRNESARGTAFTPGNGNGQTRSSGESLQSRGWARRLSLALKQALDFSSAAFLLLLTAPLFFVVALFIKLTSSGPVFFAQQRVGHQGKLFSC